MPVEIQANQGRFDKRKKARQAYQDIQQSNDIIATRLTQLDNYDDFTLQQMKDYNKATFNLLLQNMQLINQILAFLIEERMTDK